MLVDYFCVNIYSSYLWCNYSQGDLSTKSVVYNNIYPKLLVYSRRDRASDIYVSNGIDDFNARFRHTCYGFICKKNRVCSKYEDFLFRG